MSKRYKRPLTADQIAALPDEDIDTSDIEELDAEFWAKAEVRPPQTKSVVSLRLPAEVIAHFKAENPKGYTGRMAAVLAAYVAAKGE